MTNRTHRSRLLLAASALALTAGTAYAEDLVLGVDAGVNADVDAAAGTIIVPRSQSADATTAAGTDAEAGAGVTLIAPVAPGVEASADASVETNTQGSASLAAWTPDDFAGASVVNETGMRVATVDGVVAGADGEVNLVLTIDAQPGAKRAVPFERFGLGTSGNALLLVGASDADLVAMADYEAAADGYTPITTEAELQALLSADAGR